MRGQRETNPARYERIGHKVFIAPQLMKATFISRVARPPITIGDLELHRLSYLHHHLPDHLNDQCGLIFVDQMSASGGDDLPALRREVC